jgi:hypothetical protein
MSGFWSNTVSNLVGTFVGAGLALLSAWYVATRDRARSEAQSLQRLVDRIYRSRAYWPVPIGPVRTHPLAADEQADFERVTASILITRALIEKAADSLDPKRKSVAILDDIYVAILKYLNATEVNAHDYVNESMRLREELVLGEQRLKQLHPKLILRLPGTAELQIKQRTPTGPDAIDRGVWPTLTTEPCGGLGQASACLGAA